MPATKDGRCWACVQRRRWYDEEVAEVEHDGLRHLSLGGSSFLCRLPRRGRSARPEAMREYRRRSAEKAKAADPEGYRRRKTEVARRRDRRRLYGLTPEAYDAMLEAQGGRCPICRSEEIRDVDHDHDTGVVRGLLCGPCNRMLGQAKEDPARLEAGAAYLRRWSPARPGG